MQYTIGTQKRKQPTSRKRQGGKGSVYMGNVIEARERREGRL